MHDHSTNALITNAILLPNGTLSLCFARECASGGLKNALRAERTPASTGYRCLFSHQYSHFFLLFPIVFSPATLPFFILVLILDRCSPLFHLYALARLPLKLVIDSQSVSSRSALSGVRKVLRPASSLKRVQRRGISPRSNPFLNLRVHEIPITEILFQECPCL